MRLRLLRRAETPGKGALAGTGEADTVPTDD
jgi:hypothetical protein